MCECCRFGWYPRLLALLITGAFALSLFSSLDCKFLTIVLGFQPRNYSKDEIGVGLWCYESHDGRCVSFREAYEKEMLSMSENLYSDWFMSNDMSWTTSRILAIASALFGLISFVSVWANTCKKDPFLLDILSYATIISFLSEGAKFGLFFNIVLCTSQNYWYDDGRNEYSGAEGCYISKSGFICIGSISAYFLAMLLCIGHIVRPKHNGEDDYDYGDTSLTSWMHDSPNEPALQTKQSTKGGMAPERARRRSSASCDDFDPNFDPYFDDGNEFPPNPKPEGGNTYSSRYEDNNHPPGAGYSSAMKRCDDVSVITWDPGY